MREQRQVHRVQRLDDRFIVVSSRFGGVGDGIAQRADRDVRLLRQQHDLCAFRQRDLTIAERPDAGDAAEHCRLARA